MQVTTDIQSKEKSLAELMARILQEPIRPVGDSIKELKDRVLDTQDEISEMHDAVNLLMADSGNSAKSIAQSLKKLRDESLPDLLESVQQTIEVQAQQAAASLDKQAAGLLAFSSDASTRFDEAAALDASLRQALVDLQTRFESAHERQFDVTSSAAGVAQAALQEVSACRALLDTGLATLESQLKASVHTKASLAQLGAVLVAQHRAAQEGAQTLVSSLGTAQETLQTSIANLSHQTKSANESAQAASTTLAKVLLKENAALAARMEVTHEKLKTLALTSTVFFASMVIYVGYDIWSRFH